MNEKQGVIYILTNPSFPEYVKIGYADDIDRRLADLNRTECTPFAFRVYATYAVQTRLTDLKIHEMIDRINPALRSIDNVNGKKRVREFYAMSAEDAYLMFEAMAEIHGTTDLLVKIKPDSKQEEEEDIEIVEIAGRTFFATMMIVKDPSKVSLATIYPWKDKGLTLDNLVKDNDAVAGINAGLYESSGNSGGRPCGVVVSNGEILMNEPQGYAGLVLIGLTEENILVIQDVSKMSSTECETYITDNKIRDAVCFQEEKSDKNNHFVQLIINGEQREMNGMGSGLNPRTAIGQRADGTLLFLVTDGRGSSGHLGASASDLINIMAEYDAVNAANLDGGSSSCMYYEDEYLMNSVMF